ncbi:hypothetical protein BDF14DRAFT_363042 [Spinellus fusiger]|nr:hypothetical protein BDF14DRAFT_363042 [Spinellus fusiger]
MSDLNWCTYCDKSDSLYCSEDCLRSDALNHHPLLGYDYAEFKDFPRSSPGLSPCSTVSSSSPSLSPIPSYTLPSPHLHPTSTKRGSIDYQRTSHRLSPPLLELEAPTKPLNPPALLAFTPKRSIFF